MADAYIQLKTRLATEQHTWLITGVAGFIGSNLLETLLQLNQHVVGLDSFVTGHQHNLDDCRRTMQFTPSPLAGEGRGEGGANTFSTRPPWAPSRAPSKTPSPPQ